VIEFDEVNAGGDVWRPGEDWGMGEGFEDSPAGDVKDFDLLFPA